MIHYAVCYEFKPGERTACVMSFDSIKKARDMLVNTGAQANRRIGYVGETVFEEAVRRVGMMERFEPGAWGQPKTVARP